MFSESILAANGSDCSRTSGIRAVLGIRAVGLGRRLDAFLPRGRFVQSVGVLAGGTALGQLVVVLASPLLARLYTPHDFGVLAIYGSLLGILSTVATLRYELAIPLPEKEQEGAGLVVLALGVCLGMSLVLAATLWIWGNPLVHFANAPALRPHLWLLPVGIALVGTYQTFNYWAVRRGAFPLIARTKLSQAAANVGLQLGLGILGAGPLGLLVGDVAGRTAGVTTLSHGGGNTLRSVTFRDVRRLALRYKRFPLISSFSGLLNSAGLQMPVILLATLFGSQAAGWFLMVQRVMGAPVTLLGQATAQVYFGEAAELRLKQPENLRAFFIKIALRLFVLGGLPIGLIGLTAPWTFPLLFGPDWRMAGWMAQALTAMYVMQFVVYPLSQTLNVLERQDLQLAWDIARLLLVITSMGVASFSGWDAIGAVVALGVVMLVGYLGLGIITLWVLARTQ